MAQIIPFPGTAHALAPAIVAAATSYANEGGAPASPSFPIVRPIRKGVRIAKKPTDADEATALTARIAASYARKAEALAQTDPGSKEHRFALGMVGIDQKLPRNNLRCILSTLDEERDFDLRCAELEVLRAEHALESRRIDCLRVWEAVPWYESPTLKPLVDANNRLWEVYRARVSEMAETPARTYAQLERKRRLIGKCWLSGTGDWHGRLRSAVDEDEAWLAEHRPKRRRRV